MNDGEEERILKETSKNMRATVQTIEEHIRQQDLLYESIEVETAKNDKLFFSNMSRFEETMRRMNSDPRNKIIFVLTLVVAGCSFYLFS